MVKDTIISVLSMTRKLVNANFNGFSRDLR